MIKKQFVRRLFQSLFVLTTVFCSCNQNNSEPSQKADSVILKTDTTQIKNNDSQTNIKPEISIDTFSVFPPEIEGCSCYFSNDSIQQKNQTYIYVSNYADISFLKINGTLTKFKQVDLKESDKATTTSKFVSDEYEMTIQTKDGIQNGDETWLKTGTITLLQKKSGKTITKTFYGECGC